LKADREKWDSRYAEEAGSFPAPDEFLIAHESLLKHGRALDLACGRGGNAIFLAERGYSVDAVDISFQALNPLHAEAVRRKLDIHCVVADLDRYFIPNDVYDLVIVFYYFSKPLMRNIKGALKERGLIFYSTFNDRHTSVRPEFNPAYLVSAERLLSYFDDFDLLVYEPAAGEHRNVSRLIARKQGR
jgi:tellurite methyltransferase